MADFFRAGRANSHVGRQVSFRRDHVGNDSFLLGIEGAF